MIKIHYLQHVPFEGLSNIESWAVKRGCRISATRLYADEKLPGTDDFDWLVIMGGPMNIYEEKKYPWLVREKQFIEKAIAADRIVLGICLGSQLIADVLGGRVYKNREKEIGWYPVRLTEEAKKSTLFARLPESFTAFHWHGDTFDIPAGCLRTVESEGCSHQAFEYNRRVVGLQFHLESSMESIELLVQNCADELVAGKYIQTSREILAEQRALQEIEETMTLFLDSIENEFVNKT
jgi:GMP synthase-like glutamine amidotransferase